MRRVTPSETQLQSAVIELAERLGWRVFHCPDCRKCPGSTAAGFPDLVLAHSDGRVMFRELKVGRNALTDEQTEWGERLCPQADWSVWHDNDWRCGTIEKELR